MKKKKIGLALAGGGPLGGVYELGTLLALEEAVEGLHFDDLHAYVGVSAGSFMASCLANGITVSELTERLILHTRSDPSIGPEVFLTPAYKEFAKRIFGTPKTLVDMTWDAIRNPFDGGLFGALDHLSKLIPTGFLDNEPLERYLENLFGRPGLCNDFRNLQKSLVIVAVNLDTSQPVMFGSKGFRDVPISKAVQASTALPGVYPPVRIGDGDYVDGALRRTIHASAAINAGADLIIGVNPIVPFDASLADATTSRGRIADSGLPVVISQTLRSIIYSRMRVGMKAYEERFAGKEVVLFEPSHRDSRMFFANILSYSNRRQVCQHAYRTTRRQLLKRHAELKPIFENHGLRIRKNSLKDKERGFLDALRYLTPAEDEKYIRRRNRLKLAI